MFKLKERISVFDIEEDLIKLAQVEIEETKGYLYRLIAERAEDSTISALSKTLHKLAANYKVTSSRVILNVPRYKVTVKNLKLPSVNHAEIENMVKLQASKQLPFAPDKIISGYRIKGRDDKGYSDIILALAHRDAIEKMLKPFDVAGIGVDRLALNSEAISLWYVARQREEEKGESLCLADIGKKVLDMHIIKDGDLLFTRSVNFISADDMEIRMAEELKKTLFTYKKNLSGPDVTKLVLTGRRSVIKKEAPALKGLLGIPTVFIDLLKQCPKREKVDLPDESMLDIESFTSVLSLGFNHSGLKTNLIPQEVRQRRVTKVLKENLVMSVILLLCVILGIAGIATKNFIDKKRYLTLINQGIMKAKPEVNKLIKIKRITYIIKKQLRFEGSSIDILKELYSRIPSQITLSIFDCEDGRLCLLRGMSQSLSDVFKFISILEESEYFENVKVRYATKRVIGNKEITDFEIICDLTQG
ncbi:MAG: pilus assembly protein PilM [Candidatus Omnitrophica bacterium]|nr:pilus assembly protein PilM [Candidatus Omnitrophota bacterium]